MLTGVEDESLKALQSSLVQSSQHVVVQILTGSLISTDLEVSEAVDWFPQMCKSDCTALIPCLTAGLFLDLLLFVIYLLISIKSHGKLCELCGLFDLHSSVILSMDEMRGFSRCLLRTVLLIKVSWMSCDVSSAISLSHFSVGWVGSRLFLGLQFFKAEQIHLHLYHHFI